MTPAALAANRRNAKKAGRPSKCRYDEVFADLEDPPEDDPLAMCLWVQRVIARAFKETAQGRGQRERNAELRALGGLIIRAVPTERLAAVEKHIDGATKARRKPAVKRGPEVERVTPGPAGSGGGAFIRR